MIRFILPFLVAAVVPALGEPGDNGANSGQPAIAWIWKSAMPKDREKVFFRREFQLPPNISGGAMTVSCDNWSHVIINGNDLGMANDWQNPRTYDVTSQLKPGGRNVIAVEGRNDDGAAGLALRLRVTLKDGKNLHVVSDGTWLCAGEAADGWSNPDFKTEGWSPAAVITKMGGLPWGKIMPAEPEEPGMAKDMTASFRVAPGFKLERIYQIPSNQGSWVAVTVDGNGRLICSDQYGKIYRVTVPAVADSTPLVEPLDIPLQGAHGLLWNDGVLWVSVNEGSDQSGIWRVIDSNGDGEPDTPELVKAFNGRGEHGPHQMALSPDKKSIYVTCGNFTTLPEMDSSLVSPKWAEDQLLPRLPDANGHARDRMAPGGWIARFTIDGKNFQLFASGFRNAYDLAFNDQGDLFTYDSDMEWDLGMPWYRPTRICQVVPGAEFGWRNGSGPWPPYYEDSMSPLVEIGPGSPTGVLSGAGAKFPAKYQQAIFAMDWTFATLYAIHLTPQGGGYHAEREEFISGSGLPLTDGVIGKDGAMYFLTGGRRTASALWKVSYVGSEPVALVAATEPKGRDEIPLGQFVADKEMQTRMLDEIWQSLGLPDRLERYKARLLLEQIPVGQWREKIGSESQPWRVIGASLALARTGSAEDTNIILTALLKVDWNAMDLQQQLNWLRAAGLVFARNGFPDEATRNNVIAKIDPQFPAKNDFLNRELCRVLAYLQAPGIVARTLTLIDSAGPSPAPDWLDLAQRNASYGKTVNEMIANLPPAQVIHYVLCLHVVKGPWHEDERKRFFAWLAKLASNSGGNSYSGFIADLRKRTLATCTPEERAWIEKLKPGAPPNPFANLPVIKGPGHEWTVDEITKLAEGGLEGRSKELGHDMFRASLCAACHRFGGEGGSAGPDLSSLAGRFSVKDIAESVLDPNKVISDQFAFDLISRTDGTEVMGKVVQEKDEKWIIATSPFDFTQTIEIERNNIKGMKRSPVSPMPPGLINRLNADELKDLLAFLLGK